MEAIARTEIEPDKKSYFSMFGDFLRKKKLGVVGVAAFSLMGTGCMSFGSLEARTYDEYRYGNRYGSGGQQIEFVTRVLQPDRKEEPYRTQEFNPLLEVVEGEYAGLRIRIRETERRGNREALERARWWTNNDYLTKDNRFVRVTGEVERKFEDLWDIDPEFLTFSFYDEKNDRMVLEDTIYTDINTADTGWMHHYTAYSRALDWWGWGNPFHHNMGWGWNYCNDWFWGDRNWNGIPDGLEHHHRGFWNPHAHWYWFNLHHHHKNHFEPDGHGGYRPKPIVIRKHELEQPDKRGFRIIDKESLKPSRDLVDRIKRGEIDRDRAIKREYNPNDRAVRRSGGTSDNNRAVKKKEEGAKTQPVPRTYVPATKREGTEQESNEAAKKKDDDNGRTAFLNRNFGEKRTYSSSGSTATNSTSTARYVPRSDQNAVNKEYKTDFSSFKARTPVYRDNSRDKNSSSSSSSYRKDSDSSSRRVYVPKSSYSGSKSSSSSSGSSGSSYRSSSGSSSSSSSSRSSSGNRSSSSSSRSSSGSTAKKKG